MTTINDISDLVRILQEHPEWKNTIRGLIIGEELAQLPQRVTRLEQTLADFIEATNRNFELVHARLDSMGSSIDSMGSSIDFMGSSIDSMGSRMDSRMDSMGSRMDSIDARMDSMDSRMDSMDSRLDSMDRRMDSMDSRMDRMDQRFDAIDRRFDHMEERLDNGFGINYELKVGKNILSIAGQHLGIRRARVLRGAINGFTSDIQELIEDALDDRTITPEQADELLQVDLILAGRHQDTGEETYMAAELSITIGSDDITRAADRASLLQSVVRSSVLPVVVGARIDDARAAMASDLGVSVAISPE